MKVNKIITLVVIALSFCVFDQLKNNIIHSIDSTNWLSKDIYPHIEAVESNLKLHLAALTGWEENDETSCEDPNASLNAIHLAHQVIKKVINS